MQTALATGSEPIPGYRLLAPLGRGGFGEVWKCEAPGGMIKAVKIVPGVDDDNALNDGSGRAAREQKALERIRQIRHPYLLSVDRIEIVQGDLVVVTELADRTLADVLEECRGKGEAGIPRQQLLGYLREAAEALDVLNFEHGLEHLDVKPHNLFLVHGHVKVGDFGLVASLWDTAGQPGAVEQLDAVSPLYAAPESFLGRVTVQTDQYSLAVTYFELLTGLVPFQGKNFRQLALERLQTDPDLAALPEADRVVVRRALSREPRDRFPTCRGFIEALAADGADSGALQGQPLPPASPTRPIRRPGFLGDTTQVHRPRPGEPGVPVEQPAPAADPLEGYTLASCLTRLATGEVWRARAARGEERLVHLVFGYEAVGGEHGDQELLERLRELRHPSLVERELVLDRGGRLASISALHERSLVDRLTECLQGGLPGIPRAELLDYLTELAAALDDLRERYRLRHLALGPGEVLLVPRPAGRRGHRVAIADFGLAEMVWLPAGYPPSSLNTRYAAPEMFLGQVSSSCDQYSLALVYQEMLTGVHPFRNLNPRQMAHARLRGGADLGMLPAHDRPMIARALQSDPERRFGSCTELVEALRRLPGSAAPTRSIAVSETLFAPHGGTRSSVAAAAPGVETTVLAPLLRQAAGSWLARSGHGYRYLLEPGECLLHRGFASLPPGAVHLRLAAFCRQWSADHIVAEQGRHLVVIHSAGSFWQRWLGRRPGLEVDLRLAESAPGEAGPTGFLVLIHPLPGSGPRGKELLQRLGPRLLDSLRRGLQAQPERRRSERFPFRHQVEVCPLLEDGRAGEIIPGETFDLSRGGMGLCLPYVPPSRSLGIRLGSPLALHSGLHLAGEIVRSECRPDGRHAVGIRFQAPGERA